MARNFDSMERLETFPQRLRWAREKAKLTQPQLAQLCGWDSQSRISHYETGRRQADPTDLEALAGALRSRGVDISPAWLQWGEGPVSAPPGVVLAQIARDYNVTTGPDIHGEVPLVSWVQAGAFAEVSDPVLPGQADEWLPSPKRVNGRLVALRVRGDSMTSQYGKSYPDGSVIFVNLDQRLPANGQRIVAKLEGEAEATFKVYVEDAGRRWLKPLNPQYPPIHDPFRVIGTVVGKWEEE